MQILERLWNTTYYSYGMRVNLFGFPMPKNYLNTCLYRLNDKGFIKNVSGRWQITTDGKKHFQEKRLSLKFFDSPFQKSSPKNLIVMFDIPETHKKQRVWFRKHLIKFQYQMIQKSVWVGPSPLPKDFVNFLKEIGLESCIKTFKLSKPYKK